MAYYVVDEEQGKNMNTNEIKLQGENYTNDNSKYQLDTHMFMGNWSNFPEFPPLFMYKNKRLISLYYLVKLLHKLFK